MGKVCPWCNQSKGKDQAIWGGFMAGILLGGFIALGLIGTGPGTAIITSLIVGVFGGAAGLAIYEQRAKATKEP